jgi:hypothetical protein
MMSPIQMFMMLHVSHDTTSMHIFAMVNCVQDVLLTGQVLPQTEKYTSQAILQTHNFHRMPEFQDSM